MEGINGNCLVCGEDVGSLNCNDGGSPLQSYFNGLQSQFQGGINIEGKQLMACDGCSKKVNSVQNGKEEVEGLQKKVSILEVNLQQKLLELESAGERQLSGLKELELLIKAKDGSQQKNLKELDDYFQEGTGKALCSVANTLKKVEEKRSLVRKLIGGGGGIETDMESTPEPGVSLISSTDVEMEDIDKVMMVEGKDIGINSLTNPEKYEVVKKVQLEKGLIGTARLGIYRKNQQKAFELFPQEIWEMTLDQMESKDILTVLRVLPHLDISISNHKRFWYIDQILPFLGNLITNEDVLNLRLVCKQWQSRVDNFLPNQPYCRAYSEELHKDNPNFWSFLENNRFKGKSPDVTETLMISDIDDPPTTIEEMTEHPGTRNPLVFRFLNLNIVELEDAFRKAYKVFDFLRHSGSHVWFLCVNLSLPLQNSEIRALIEILELTRNLKSLSIEAFVYGDDDANCKSSVYPFKKRLPELPFLETLKIFIQATWIYDGGFEHGHEISSGFIMRYGPQIKRLKMNVDHWRTEFKNLLPNLTELESSIWFHPRKPADIIKTDHLLNTLSSPNLAKLQLEFGSSGRDKSLVPFTIQRDIFQWLKRFPKIKFFELSTDCIDRFRDKLRLEADPIKDCIPSIETLKIVDGHGLSYEILHCFPSLRHLVITCYNRPSVVDLSMPDSCVKIREQLQTAKLYESNIWELFPKLRKVHLVGLRFNNNVYEFNREAYEMLKNAGRIPSEPQLHDLRQDIQKFLNDNVEEKPMDERRLHRMILALLVDSGSENEDSDESDDYENI